MYRMYCPICDKTNEHYRLEDSKVFTLGCKICGTLRVHIALMSILSSMRPDSKNPEIRAKAMHLINDYMSMPPEN